jgi:hypothetical protein
MSKHTPGPWFVDEAHIVRVGRPGSGFLKPVKIATGWKVDAWVDGDSDEESRANAHLIAEAPVLLAELEYLVEVAESAMRAANRDGGEYDIGEMLEAPRAAIAKAKGEAQ